MCISLKAHANGRNIVGEQHATLLDPTCYVLVHLHGTTTMLAFVAYSVKPVKLLGPYKRTKHCWRTTRNIVGEQHATLLGPTCCVRVHLHGTTTMLAFVAYSLKPVKLLGPYKRTKHCWPTKRDNVVTCCARLHSPYEMGYGQSVPRVIIFFSSGLTTASKMTSPQMYNTFRKHFREPAVERQRKCCFVTLSYKL